jgi:hypothetical protein
MCFTIYGLIDEILNTDIPTDTRTRIVGLMTPVTGGDKVLGELPAQLIDLTLAKAHLLIESGSNPGDYGLVFRAQLADALWVSAMHRQYGDSAAIEIKQGWTVVETPSEPPKLLIRELDALMAELASVE